VISAAFIRRPRLAVVIAIVITIAGAIAMLRIPVAQFPDIVPPRVQVTANYPGASAAVVEAAIAQPLEAQIVGVDKMIYMKSTSGNDGSYNLTVSFAVGTNPDTDTVNVNNRVQTALPQLPQAVQLQGLTVIKRSAAVLQFMNLYSETGQLSPVQITSYATINVLDELSRVTGVGQALLFGKLNYSMRIWFDTQRLTSLNLAPSDVVNAIQAQNVQAPVGRIGARPVSDDQQFQLNVQTQGTLTTPEQFSNIVLRANPDGSVLRIGDVARVEMGAQNSDNETRINGRPAVGVALYLAPDANAVATAAAVEKTLNRLRARFPADLKAYVVYDSTVFVNDTIHEVLTTVFEAFILVVIVVFLFLGSLRATIIPAVAVPVSLIGTFAFLLLAGYSANTVSLLALVLAIGIVVDDAIVVVENVERVMQEHPDLEPHEATMEAMRQITGPIIAISLVLLSVFVPVAFIPGISGQLFRQFAVTISIAMLISALNALTLSPALCAIFLRHEIPTRGPIFQVLRAINVVRDGYARVVQRLIRVSLLSLLLVALIGGGIFGLARITPTSFLPEEDQGAFFLNVQLPDGASVARTSETMRQVEAMLKTMPQVQDVFAVIGFSLLDGANEANTAFAVAKLRPFEDRRGAADSAQALIRRTFAEAGQIRTANIVAFNLPPIIGLSTSGGFEYQLEGLEGQDPVRLGAVMGGVVAAANQDPRLSRVFSTFTASNPSIYLDIDRDKAQALGLAMNDVFTALQSTLGRLLRQQFQPLRSHLAGEHPGRGQRSPAHRGHLPDPGAQPAGRDGAAALDRRPALRARAAGDHPLQQLPLDHHQRRAGAGPLLGRCADGDERGVGQDPAAGLRLRMDRHRLPGIRGGGADRADPRPGRDLRLPVPRGAVRELDDPDAGAALGLGRGARRLCRHPDRQADARPLRPDRPGGPDRARRQERHPDRRVRQGAAGEGPRAVPRRHIGRAHAIPVGDDDLVRLHPRPGAAGIRTWRGADQPARYRHLGVRRHAGRQHRRHLPDPDALRRVPAPARVEAGPAEASRGRRPLPEEAARALTFDRCALVFSRHECKSCGAPRPKMLTFCRRRDPVRPQGRLLIGHYGQWPSFSMR